MNEHIITESVSAQMGSSLSFDCSISALHLFQHKVVVALRKAEKLDAISILEPGKGMATNMQCRVAREAYPTVQQQRGHLLLCAVYGDVCTIIVLWLKLKTTFEEKNSTAAYQKMFSEPRCQSFSSISMAESD